MPNDKILIVDDEPDFVEAMAKRLQNHDMDVETAGSGDEALGKAKSGDFTAIVLDLKMRICPIR